MSEQPCQICLQLRRGMLRSSMTAANAAEPISLRDMGSFHVGGRLVEIIGKPVKEVTFTPGGVPAKVDPNGDLPGRADVCAVFPARQRDTAPFRCCCGMAAG